MKYCTLCNKVYPNEVKQCLCNDSSWRHGELKTLPIEPLCKDCGSNEELSYREPWNGLYGVYGNECQCSICKKKIEDKIQREEAMKYLIIDDYQDETIFCEDRDEVEKHLKYYTDEPWEYESAMKDVLILKLEHVTGKVKPEQFKPPHNTHLVFWDCEAYRVEEVIEPELSNDGCDYSLNW